MEFRKKNNYWYVKYEALRQQMDDLSSTIRLTAADEEGRCITERAVKSGNSSSRRAQKRCALMFEVTCRDGEEGQGRLVT
jgi:hypothetical protein